MRINLSDDYVIYRFDNFSVLSKIFDGLCQDLLRVNYPSWDEYNPEVFNTIDEAFQFFCDENIHKGLPQTINKDWLEELDRMFIRIRNMWDDYSSSINS